jgi:hypothetical protein
MKVTTATVEEASTASNKKKGVFFLLRLNYTIRLPVTPYRHGLFTMDRADNVSSRRATVSVANGLPWLARQILSGAWPLESFEDVWWKLSLGPKKELPPEAKAQGAGRS